MSQGQEILGDGCRSCMKSSVDLVDLFQPLEMEDGNRVSLDKTLMMCTATQITPKDGLPQHVCRDCIRALIICHKFSEQAQHADKEFKRLMHTTKLVKHEINIKTEMETKSDNEQENYFEFGDDLLHFNQEFFQHDDVKSEDKKYECKLCSKKFKIEIKFLKHTAKCKSNLTIPCDMCLKFYESRKSYMKHVDKHEKNGYKCRFCKKIFGIKSLLQTHVIEHKSKVDVKLEPSKKCENNSIFQCKDCPMSFSKARSLGMHIKVHKKKEKDKFICDMCQKVFSVKTLLRRHVRLHTNLRKYGCNQCPKKYSRQDELDAHVKFKHQLIKPFVCNTCNKSFSQRCNLSDHERIHSGETPYLCTECGKGFKNSSNLRQHLQRHTGVKPYSCKLCPMRFVTKGQMISHEKTHLGLHPYTCEICGAAFTKPNSLKKHKLIHTGIRPHQCSTCHMTFTCKDHLTRHVRIHTGEKPYKCSHCERTFTQSNDLVKHTRAHVGVNVYQCKICSMRFRLVSELKQHYPSHYVDGEPSATILPEQGNSFLVPKPEEDLKMPVQGPQIDNTNKFERTITITWNSEGGIAEDITINISPEDLEKSAVEAYKNNMITGL